MRKVTALVLTPSLQNLPAHAQHWVAGLGELTQNTRIVSKPPAHSSRPAQMRVHTAAFDSPGDPGRPWTDQLRDLPLLADAARFVIEPHAGQCSHLIVLRASALQCLALGMALAQFGARNSFPTVFVEPTFTALKLLSEPFGRQIAGRVQAMSAAAGVELYMLASGAASEAVLRDLGFRVCTDVLANPVSGHRGGPGQGSGRSITVNINDLSGPEGAKNLSGYLAGHEDENLHMTVDADNARSAGWTKLLEEAVVRGVDLRVSRPIDRQIERIVDMAFLASRPLSLASAGRKEDTQAIRLWNNRQWKKDHAPTLWIESILRKEHDQLGHAVKQITAARRLLRIDTR